MIRNDFRYIIKKILIGIGIFIGIFYFKSCTVNALEDTSNMTSLFNSTYFGHNFSVYLDSANNRIYGKRDTTEQFVDINGYDYMVILKPSNGSRITQFCVFNKTPFVYNNTIIVSEITYQRKCFDLATSGTQVFTVSSGTFSNYNNGIEYSNRFNYLVNFDLKDSNNHLLQSKNLDIPWGVQPPEIVSLNPTLNENDDVLVSVSFSPEFSYMDTTNYNYYAWFEGYDKFLIHENNTTLNTQNNTTFYVEITDKQGNTIDTESYTVSRIGQYDVSDYQIQFSSEFYTESDTNNESKPVDYINRVDIDMLYMPKSPYLKYQYQFVLEGDFLTNNWITINPDNSSDLSKNDFVYITPDNGTLYARIVDLDGVLKYSSTYTVSTIGEVKYYANDTGVGGFFNKITNKLDYSGPISSLISIPIRLFSSLLSESSKSCTPYVFGNLLGSDITFSCVNVENYIGSNLYHLLDLLMSFGLVLGISHFIKKQYNKFTSLNDKNEDVM